MPLGVLTYTGTARSPRTRHRPATVAHGWIESGWHLWEV